jgi:hypothetical protein
MRDTLEPMLAIELHMSRANTEMIGDTSRPLCDP